MCARPVALALLPIVLSAGLASAETTLPDPTAAEVDAVFAKWDTTRTPGCALAIIRGGHIVYRRGYGMANLDHDVPIRPTTVFHVASISKQFTDAAIVLLTQEGKLSLDDEIHQHLPELPDLGVSITIRDLVHHTSGLRDQWELLELAGWRYSLDLITDRDVLELVSRQRELNFEPRSEFAYCNTGYTLLAQIVARVSGQSFREFTTARIFKPLGMTRTHFRDDHAEIVKGQAYGYKPTKDGGFRLSVTNFDTVGATSLLTTVEDLAAWDRNFNEKTVGGATMVDQLHERGRLASGKELAYAFGLVHGEYRGQPIVDHVGADAGYRSYLMRFPEQRFSVACLCNVSTAVPVMLARRVADICLRDTLGPAEASPRPSEFPRLSDKVLSNRAGLYWCSANDQFLELVMREGELALLLDEEKAEKMRAIDESRFRIDRWQVEFDFDSNVPGVSPSVKRLTRAGEAQPFERVERSQPSREKLGAYVGDYVSDEIEAVYSIAFTDGALMLRRLRHEPVRLRSAIHDVFLAPSWTVRFRRDSHNRVSGMVLNSQRVRNFKLSRSDSGTPSSGSSTDP